MGFFSEFGTGVVGEMSNFGTGAVGFFKYVLIPSLGSRQDQRVGVNFQRVGDGIFNALEGSKFLELEPWVTGDGVLNSPKS